ncbi:XRE family transcriptional regulator [Xanthobacter sp. DSM 14520]|uniref:helix-turn-helix domain-containing protein n=1 Tax=Xanthobacter autotrophicus (strain ATCC BAA-1158 / Py2) TaxID=78245 RepID=UPI003726AC22
MSNNRFASVWDAIAERPEEAANLKLRAELMTTLRVYIVEKKLSQAAAASLFGVTQPRVSDLKRGKIALFSLDVLVKMAADAGFEVGLTVHRAA